MLKLDDFFHLAEIEPLFDQIASGGPGLVVVAGPDPRAQVAPPGEGSFISSGRSMVFRILMRGIMEAVPSAKCVIITHDQASIRVTRKFHHRTTTLPVRPPATYASRIAEAISRHPELIVVDRLDAEGLPAALDAARQGFRLLSQFDTVLRGVDVLHELAAAGETGLAWVVSVQRVPVLCPHCKQPLGAEIDPLPGLRRRYARLGALLSSLENPVWHGPVGCERCDYGGHQGEVMVFDVLGLGDTPASDLVDHPGPLSMEEYVIRLAHKGYLSPDDVLRFENDLFRRTYHMLVASGTALSDSNSRLERKLAELESANRVLEQRTQALISLHDIGQALISSATLDELAARVCRRACELCSADRAILYYLHGGQQAEILSVIGWDPALLHRQIEIDLPLCGSSNPAPRTFDQLPPGIAPDPRYMQGVSLGTGLQVPLIAQDQCVGLMIIHSTSAPRFAPGQTALLQTYANQAALALQRAGLTEQLRAKIVQLEAAQVELAQKERIERELELARQVQQRMLPRTFPDVHGYRFAARNEPARQVGGDFYDVIWLDADRFGIAVADVSDKGMPSALYMALTRSLLFAEARRERSPRQVLTNVNQLLLELGEPNMFVTVFYGVVECAARRLTFARAGHDRPLLVRPDAVQELGGYGPALGLFGDNFFRLTEEQVDLIPGDRLVLYTDGLTDIAAGENRFFEKEQLKSLLQVWAALLPAQLCERVFAELRTFQRTATQFDDMTMLAMAVD